MTHYLLSNLIPSGSAVTPDELQQIMTDVTTLTQEMQSEGVWVFAMGLAGPEQVTVAAAGGRGSFTDGPFSESKEYVGGFTVIDVPDDETARSWATRTATATRLAIEVRPGTLFG